MHKLRKVFALLAMVVLVVSAAVPVFAEEPTFAFEVTVDGGAIKEAKPGDIVTVMLRLKRTDSDTPYTMYGMQAELRYDSEFFELVPNSFLTASGIDTADVELVDHHREVYMSYISMTGGSRWEGNTLVGSFQLKVKGTGGASRVVNQNSFVSFKDGSGSYESLSRDLTVIVSLDCTVKFETNGGSEIADAAVTIGNKLAEPQPPVKEGWVFDGWYKDMELTDPWDFEKDTVENNMTLYARWAEAAVSAPAEETSGLGMQCWIVAAAIVLILILLLVLLIRRRKQK